MATNGQDFTIPKRQVSYELLPELVLAGHPEFQHSEEYKGLVEDGMDDLPGVFLAAFGRYWLGLIDTNNDVRFSEACKFLEELVAANEPDVTEAVVVEIFEVLSGRAELLRRIRSALGPKSVELYDQHCKRP